ncbi:MAG TPA: EscU/YscU/HrcU family type III secretion system export apparatus switch protein, partial [Burkholderiaceae bacterium]
MADNNDAQDRNLPASAKKIERSRSEGQLPRSRDLPHFLMLATVGALLASFAPELSNWLGQLLGDALRFDARAVASPALMGERLQDSTLRALWVMLPAGGIVCVTAVVGQVAAGGWNFSWKPLAPKFSHLNPITGVGRLLQWQGLGQALKAVLLALVLGSIGVLVMKDRIASFVGIMSVPLPAAIAYAGRQLMSGLAFLGLALALFAVIDVPLQRQL